MENLENKIPHEDEISLIDLFSVVLKYRKLIILGTLIVTFIAFILFFVLPKFSKKDQVRESYSIEYSIPILSSKRIDNILNYNLGNDVVQRFSNLNSIANFNKTYNVFNYNFEKHDFNQLKYNKFIQNLVNAKDYFVKLNTTKSDLLININTHSIEICESFILNFIEVLNKKYYEFLLPQIETRLEILDEIIADNNDINNNDIVDILNEKLELQTILKNGLVVLKDGGYSFVINNNNNNNMLKLVICAFAGFFIFTFLAFFLNAMRSIKEDKIVTKKIKSAWTEGKKLFP